MSFGIRDFAFFIVGAAFGACLIFGLHLRLCGRSRSRTVVDVPEGFLTAPMRLSRREVREIKRRWLTARERDASAAFEVPPQPPDPTPGGHGTSPDRAS